MMNRISLALLLSILAFGCSDPPGADTNNVETDGGTSDTGMTNSGMTDAGTSDMATNDDAGTTAERVPLSAPGQGNKLDLLFVIDNSGTMCDKQAVLRDEADLFFDSLADSGVDFHVGVTTTQMEETALEPLAVPGELQSTPQPLPGFAQRCIRALDESGDPIDDDFTPLREAIAAAVNCMDTPDPNAFNFTDEELRCAIDSVPNCEITGVCGGQQPCGLADLFPEESQYREIPKVLRAADYGGADNLDLSRLRNDFACMSYVGTRGSGIEQGLAAAALAVSPELTGGAVGADDADDTTPNHGLLRQDSGFGLFFFTDENDCSSETLDFTTACGDAVCDFANKEGEDGLTSLEDLKSGLIANLGTSKGRTIEEREVFVTSFHGASQRYSGEVFSAEQCRMPGYSNPVETSCDEGIGEAFSGDRYDRFMSLFPSTNVYPTATTEGVRPGLMCEPSFGPSLTASGAGMFKATDICVTGVEPGSYVVEAVATSDTAATQLAESGYCETGTFGEVAENGCVIDASRYQGGTCPQGYEGVTVTWVDESAAASALEGSDLFLVVAP